MVWHYLATDVDRVDNPNRFYFDPYDARVRVIIEDAMIVALIDTTCSLSLRDGEMPASGNYIHYRFLHCGLINDLHKYPRVKHKREKGNLISQTPKGSRGFLEALGYFP